MEMTVIVSGLALLVSLASLLMGGRKETRTDAASAARVEAKLDSIGNGVEDIRVEMRSIRSRVDAMGERLSAVESSVRSAHHRLDQMQIGGGGDGRG